MTIALWIIAALLVSVLFVLFRILQIQALILLEIRDPAHHSDAVLERVAAKAGRFVTERRGKG